MGFLYFIRHGSSAFRYDYTAHSYTSSSFTAQYIYSRYTLAHYWLRATLAHLSQLNTSNQGIH